MTIFWLLHYFYKINAALPYFKNVEQIKIRPTPNFLNDSVYHF